MTITPELASVIEGAIESALIDVHVALPGKVEAYDAAKQTARVALQVKRTLPRGADGRTYATESLPVLENVPVVFPRTGSFALTLPIQVGDTGLVVFSEMSIDQWRSKGSETSPGDVGRHTLTGGMFHPGLIPDASAIGDAAIDADLMVGQIGGIQVRLKPGGTCEVVSDGGPTADDWVAMAQKVIIELNNVLNIFSQGAPSPMDGGAALQTAWIAAAANVSASLDVASTNLKANGVGVPPS